MLLTQITMGEGLNVKIYIFSFSPKFIWHLDLYAKHSDRHIGIAIFASAGYEHTQCVFVDKYRDLKYSPKAVRAPKHVLVFP